MIQGGKERSLPRVITLKIVKDAWATSSMEKIHRELETAQQHSRSKMVKKQIENNDGTLFHPVITCEI